MYFIQTQLAKEYDTVGFTNDDLIPVIRKSIVIGIYEVFKDVIYYFNDPVPGMTNFSRLHLTPILSPN